MESGKKYCTNNSFRISNQMLRFSGVKIIDSGSNLRVRIAFVLSIRPYLKLTYYMNVITEFSRTTHAEYTVQYSL